MSDRRKQIEELVFLEQKFIIGSHPLTEKQKDILENIGAMELGREYALRKLKRYERVIDALRLQLVNQKED